MSRGYGYVQRFVLAVLDEQWAAGDPWVQPRVLSELLDGEAPTRRTCRSVRRALRRLAADGLVELEPSGVGASARIAPARIDAMTVRRERRELARELRRQLSMVTLALVLGALVAPSSLAASSMCVAHGRCVVPRSHVPTSKEARTSIYVVPVRPDGSQHGGNVDPNA